MNTRERLIAVATEHFAQRGFYGTSVAQISGELNITKQALLHHFKSKEKLYAEVLQRISEELMQRLPFANNDVKQQTPESVFTSLCEVCLSSSTTTQLLIRELLDNKQRAKTARQWFLKEFLERLSDVVLRDSRGKKLNNIQAIVLVYQMLGAINYFAISKSTLIKIYDADTYQTMQNAYIKETCQLISSRLNSA